MPNCSMNLRHALTMYVSRCGMETEMGEIVLYRSYLHVEQKRSAVEDVQNWEHLQDNEMICLYINLDSKDFWVALVLLQRTVTVSMAVFLVT